MTDSHKKNFIINETELKGESRSPQKTSHNMLLETKGGTAYGLKSMPSQKEIVRKCNTMPLAYDNFQAYIDKGKFF